MLASQPATSPLGILLVIGAILLVARSPKRLQTLLRVVVAATLTMAVIFAAVLAGFPQVWLKIGGLAAELAGVIAGWWHVRSLKRASATGAAPPAA